MTDRQTFPVLIALQVVWTDLISIIEQAKPAKVVKEAMDLSQRKAIRLNRLGLPTVRSIRACSL
jgi:hypothetical protein